MPENGFSSVNHSPKEDGSQINEHLDNMSIDELTDAVTDMWDATDDLTYSAAWMDECLKKIDQMEDAPEFDVDASLNNFLSKHSRLVECASRTSENSRPKTSRWKPSIAAAIAVLVVLGSLVTAQALGIDVFGAIARWTNETFHFATSSQNGDTLNTDMPNSNSHSPDGEYGSLQEALDACGIDQNVSPQQLPDGFELARVSVCSLPSQVEIEAVYTSNDRMFSLAILQYSSPEVVGQTIFEKDSEDMILYNKNGITYYIMSNNQQLTAVWMPQELLICTVTGDLSIDEVKSLIDSIM